MLQTIKDACQFDPKAIDYALSDQIENLDDLVGHDPVAAEAFFRKTYVTGGMKTLLRQGLQRLAGSSGQAVFELKQAMGGGKTHSMLALGYLAANPKLFELVAKDITQGIKAEPAQVVAISGRSISRDQHLWGDIADQLGKADKFLEFYKGMPQAPNEKDWIGLIGDAPTLILLDELPPYFKNAITQNVGGGTLADVTTYAVSNLLSAALKLPRLCIVISNLSGAYEGATKSITTMVAKATRDLQNETGRQAKGITPVELGSDEIYNILRTRLLTKDPDQKVINAVSTAFSDSISDAVKSKTIAKSATQIADEIAASYPFHPSFKHILALFKENERFRQTRGLMTMAALMVKSALGRPTNDVYLVGCQHIDLAQPDVRDVITNVYDLSGAITHDIAGTATERAHAQTIDDVADTDAASQVARLVLMSSLSEANDAVKGLTKSQVVENLVAPQRSPHEFDEAFEKLRIECWYLHRKENDAWYFSKNENLKKKIEKYASTAAQPKIDAEMERRLQMVFEPKRRNAYSSVQALPKIEDIKPSGDRVLLVLSPDKRVPPEDAQRLFDAIVEKNNFCVVTGDGTDLAKLEDKVRRIWATAKVLQEDGGDRSPNLAELQEETETAEFEFNSTLIALFNRVYYPSRLPKPLPNGANEGLTYAALKLVERRTRENGPTTIDGEAAVEEALSATGASKLILTPADEGNAASLRNRAQDVLWGTTERKTRWKDVEERAISNVRWPWLPPKSLDEIKRTAVSIGEWRDSGDGYIEKGPFPQAKTSVKVVTRAYNDDTGMATIEPTPVDAGPNARVHFAPTKDVSGSSPVVPDTIFDRDDTVLWFLAVDPDGKHETGDPVKWSNTLTLTHQPKEVMGKRTVELTVKPRGTIRWNIDGTNAREGKAYSGPIALNGDDEVKIYAYAEDAGVEVTKVFPIRAAAEDEFKIDPELPVAIKKRQKIVSTKDVFATLKALKEARGLLKGSLSATVGQGDVNATTRFGPQTNLNSAAIETFLGAARLSIAQEAAEVEIGFSEVHFETGREMEEFVKAVGWIVSPNEVEQQ
ncbi:conserved hypothetical protein [Rhodopseudomonas palustris BisB5]|uniref:ATP-binding protein n=1 Tax=Rhodopseudomonas palustris (strain BisB5) TaxID=316057 RepID=Q13F84_RHOPS|nr:conserved hypothetical protein [Rhodopseudomonas palustris BisB5]